MTTTSRNLMNLGWLALAIIAAGCSGGERFELVPHSGQLIDLQVGGKTLKAELAIDPEARRTGLMFRESLPADQGMLFIWPASDHDDDRSGEGGLQERGMWMKNTKIPLSIAYIAEDGKILQIEDLMPHDERIIRSKDEVRFALEMTQGWFQKNGIAPGAAFVDFDKKVGKLQAR